MYDNPEYGELEGDFGTYPVGKEWEFDLKVNVTSFRTLQYAMSQLDERWSDLEISPSTCYLKLRFFAGDFIFKISFSTAPFATLEIYESISQDTPTYRHYVPDLSYIAEFDAIINQLTGA